MDKHNLANIRQSFGNSVYNWKIHEVAAEQIDQCLAFTKAGNILLVSAVLLLLSLQILPPNIIPEEAKDWMDLVGALLSVIEISFLIFLLSYGFEERFTQHKKAAMSFRSVRDRYINLITDIMNEKCADPMIVQRRDSLQTEFQTVCNLAPQTSRRNYQATRYRLRPYTQYGFGRQAWNVVVNFFSAVEVSSEDFTLHDEEIDLFLPEELRIAKK